MDSRKHPMTLLRDTTALIRELACSMNVLSAKMENCASWPQMTTVLIPTLTLSQTQMKFWETPDKHVAKVRITLPFDEATDMFKVSVTALKKHI